MPTVRHAGAEIYYEASGAGPALVLAHGAGGNTLSWWQQVPHFSLRQRVIVFDHRCFGRSRCALDDFQPVHFPGDLLAILDAEEIERATLVCQSMGGWTGLRTARDHPERVAGLVLCGTPAGILTPEVAASAARVGARASQEGMRGSAALAPDFPARQPALADLYDRISGLNADANPAVLLRRLTAEESRIEPASLTGFAVPTLFLAGEHDQLFAPEALASVARLVPGARFRLLAGVGHSAYFEDAPRFNREIDAFLAEIGV